MTKKIKKFLLGIALASSTIALGITFIVANKQKIENSKQNFQYRNLANNYKVGEDLSNTFFDYFENLEMDEIKNTISFENKDNINFLSTHNQNESKTEIIFAKDSNKAKIKVIDKKTNKISKSLDVEINFYIDDLDIEIIYNNKSYKKSEIESGLLDLKANLGAVAVLAENLPTIAGAATAIGAAVIALNQDSVIKGIGDGLNNIGNWFQNMFSSPKKPTKPVSKPLTKAPATPFVKEFQNYIIVRGREGTVQIPKMKVQVKEVAIAEAVATNELNKSEYYLSFFLKERSFLSMINISEEIAKNIVAFSGTKKTIFKRNSKGQKVVNKRMNFDDKTHWNKFVEIIYHERLRFVDIYTPTQKKAHNLAKKVSTFLESKDYFDVASSGGVWGVSEPELHGKYEDREFWHYHVQKSTSWNISYRKNSHILYGLVDNTEYNKKNNK